MSDVRSKPLYWCATLLRATFPLALAGRKVCIAKLKDLLAGEDVGAVMTQDAAELTRVVTTDLAHDAQLTEDLIESFATYGEDSLDAVETAVSWAKRYRNGNSLAQNVPMQAAAADAITKLVDMSSVIYHGSEAAIALFQRLLVGDVCPPRSRTLLERVVLNAATNHCITGAGGTGIGPGVAKLWCDVTGGSYTHSASIARNLCDDFDLMCKAMSSKKSRLAHLYYSGFLKREELFEPAESSLDDFELNNRVFEASAMKCWRIDGTVWIRVGSALFMMSQDDIDSVKIMLRRNYRAIWGIASYHGYNTIAEIAPRGKSVQDAAKEVANMIAKWTTHLVDEIHAHREFNLVLRGMHITRAIIFDDIGRDKGYNIDVDGAAGEKLRKSAEEVFPKASEWRRDIAKLGLQEADRYDFCHLYHLWIGGDGKVKDLIAKVDSECADRKDVDPAFEKDFTAFSDAALVAITIYNEKAIPALTGAVELCTGKWVEKNIAGKFTLPPRSSWGKFRLYRHFRFDRFADVYHWSPKDVTRVEADLENVAAGKLSREERIHNELTHTMAYGDILDSATRMTAREYRDRYTSGRNVPNPVIVAAHKNESAKHSAKKRATYAGSAAFRACQAESDRNWAKIGAYLRPVMSRKALSVVESEFKIMCANTRPSNRTYELGADISAWSGQEALFWNDRWARRVLEAFDMPGCENIKDVWNNMEVVVNKMGTRRVWHTRNLRPQGMKGTEDSVGHALLWMYTYQTALEKRIVSAKSKIYASVMIDDIRSSVELHAEDTKLDEEGYARKFYAHVEQTYKRARREIDPIKTIFSKCKSQFLNRPMAFGIELPYGFKTFIKANPNLENPTSTPYDYANDIMGGMQGASRANFLPWVAYIIGVYDTLREFTTFSREAAGWSPDRMAAVSITPRALGGWGIPDISTWLAGEAPDQITRFTAILRNITLHAIGDEHIEVPGMNDTAASVWLNAINRDFEPASARSVMMDPYGVKIVAPTSPEYFRKDIILRWLRDQMADIAEPYKTMLTQHFCGDHDRILSLLAAESPIDALYVAPLMAAHPLSLIDALVSKMSLSSAIISRLPRRIRVRIKNLTSRAARAMIEFSGLYETVKRKSDIEEAFRTMTACDMARIIRERFNAVCGIEVLNSTFPDPCVYYAFQSASDHAVESIMGARHTAERNCVRFKLQSPVDPFGTKRAILTRTTAGLASARRSEGVYATAIPLEDMFIKPNRMFVEGLSVLAEAAKEGHKVGGLSHYFIRSWHETADISHDMPWVRALAGSSKRLAANPGKVSHFIAGFRNLSAAVVADHKMLNSVLPAGGHLHDYVSLEMQLASTFCLSSAETIHFQSENMSQTVKWHLHVRDGEIVTKSPRKMDMDGLENHVQALIDDSDYAFSLSQTVSEVSVLIERVSVEETAVAYLCAIKGIAEEDFAAAYDVAASAKMPEDIGDAISRGAVALAWGGGRKADGHGYAPEPEEKKAQLYVGTAPGSKTWLTLAGVLRAKCVSIVKPVPLTALNDWVDGEDIDDDHAVHINGLSTEQTWSQIIKQARSMVNHPLTPKDLQRALGVCGVRNMPLLGSIDPHTCASLAGRIIRDLVGIALRAKGNLIGRSATDFESEDPIIYVSGDAKKKNDEARAKRWITKCTLNEKRLLARISRLSAHAPLHAGDKRFDDKDGGPRWSGRLAAMRVGAAIWKELQGKALGSNFRKDAWLAAQSQIKASATAAAARHGVVFVAPTEKSATLAGTASMVTAYSDAFKGTDVSWAGKEVIDYALAVVRCAEADATVIGRLILYVNREALVRHKAERRVSIEGYAKERADESVAAAAVHFAQSEDVKSASPGPGDTPADAPGTDPASLLAALTGDDQEAIDDLTEGEWNAIKVWIIDSGYDELVSWGVLPAKRSDESYETWASRVDLRTFMRDNYNDYAVSIDAYLDMADLGLNDAQQSTWEGEEMTIFDI